ncbi:MAG TPA: tRNA (adenosine(37)-N6)-threonylcarbamoyltransferase complex dimerization subunit type 1 TsaB [Gammaproteobacteria bacterium]|nr:tRNA (adenosine(37)-N6)-threonylcarbamoyltransferase complex dimerization subunit type 1 TsaB [Gammaproteobacteria bacterium]
MKLLALDTATGCCSVALLLDGEILQRERTLERAHAETVLPMAHELLKEADCRLTQLDGIAFGRGPGGFTGVRVAVSVVQGLAFGAELPVVPVSDLAALAMAAGRLHRQTRVLACMDARMGEVYAGTYELDVAECVLHGEEAVLVPDALVLPGDGVWFGAGSGFATYGDVLRERLGVQLGDTDDGMLPHARDIAALAAIMFQRGEALAVEQALPVYLRDRVAIPKS